MDIISNQVAKCVKVLYGYLDVITNEAPKILMCSWAKYLND
jgi:hypothetical protein